LQSSWIYFIIPSGTLWRCGDGLFFEVRPLANDALLTKRHPLLENVLQTVDHFEISCLGAPFSWLEKLRNLMGRDLDCMADVLMEFHRSTFSKPNTEFNSMRFLGFPFNEKARNFEVFNGLQHVLQKWMERCKKSIACQGRCFEKETVTAPPQSSDLELQGESMNFANEPHIYLFIFSSFLSCFFQHFNISFPFLIISFFTRS
jgi:hypothetical protein